MKNRKIQQVQLKPSKNPFENAQRLGGAPDDVNKDSENKLWKISAIAFDELDEIAPEGSNFNFAAQVLSSFFFCSVFFLFSKEV